MSVKFVSVLFFGWLLMTFVQGLLSGIYGGQSHLEVVLTLSVVEFKTFVFIPVPLPNLGFMAAAGHLLTWDYPWFEGNMQVVRWLTVLVVTGAASYGFVTGLLPVLLTATGQLVNAAGALNPIRLIR